MTRAETDAGMDLLGVTLADSPWLRRVSRRIELEPGAPAPDPLKVPEKDAQRILRQSVRLVADIPKGSSPEVVWAHGDSELLVHTGEIALACDTGQVTVSLAVSCDQVPEPARVDVPFAVGTEEAPSGLVMSTLRQPAGPAVIVDGWAEAIVAFTWEALVHLAQQLCAAAGADAGGLPLVPASIGAAPGVLLLQPMARHRIKP
jgi:hypothetical protein